MSDVPRIRMEGITKRYGAAFALRDVTFVAGSGEIHALIGENGAGKSTLVRVLSGAVPADAGAMQVDGVAYHPRSPHDAREQGIRAVHQEFSLVPQLSVAENLLLGRAADAGPGHRGLGDRTSGSRREPGGPGLRGHRYPSARGSPGRLTAADGGDRQGLARHAPRGHPRRTVGGPVQQGARATLRRPAGLPQGWRDRRLRVPPPGRGASHLRPHHGPQGWRAGGHRGDRRGRRAGAHPHDGRAAPERDLPGTPAPAGQRAAHARRPQRTRFPRRGPDPRDRRGRGPLRAGRRRAHGAGTGHLRRRTAERGRHVARWPALPATIARPMPSGLASRCSERSADGTDWSCRPASWTT